MLHSGPGSEDTPKEGVQVVRLASRNKIVHVATHFDEGANKDIVLWEDILVVFRDAAYVQHGQRVVPFLKGNDFKTLDPWRIAAIPGAVLDVIVKEEEGSSTTTSGAGAGAGAGTGPVSVSPPVSSTSSHGRPSSQQPVAPQQRDADAAPIRVIPPLIPQRPVQSAFVTLTPPASSSSASSPGATTTATVTPVGGQANTGRSPEYGLPEEAMANFGHFDLPPDFLMSLTKQGAATGTSTAAAEAIATGRAPQFVSGSGNHPQGASEGSLENEDEDEGEGLEERVEGMSLNGGSSPLQQQQQQQTQPRGAPQVQPTTSTGPTTSAGPTTFTTTSTGSTKPATIIDAAQLDLMISKARAGDIQQQVALGHMYRERKDFAKALEWFLEAAAAKDIQAQYNIGFMYNYGEGVARSFRVALEWYEKAAAQGDGLSEYKANKLRRDGFV